MKTKCVSIMYIMKSYKRARRSEEGIMKDSKRGRRYGEAAEREVEEKGIERERRRMVGMEGRRKTDGTYRGWKTSKDEDEEKCRGALMKEEWRVGALSDRPRYKPSPLIGLN